MRLRILALAAAAFLVLPLFFTSPAAAWSMSDRAFLNSLLAVDEPVATATADDYITFKACDPIIENTTDKAQTVTITICNSSDTEMWIDVGDGTIAKIPAGQCRTLIIKIPAGKSLHADEDGKYKLQPSATSDAVKV